MAAKKPARKSARQLGKKDLKKTKGGILIGLNQPMDPSKMNLSIKTTLDLNARSVEGGTIKNPLLP